MQEDFNTANDYYKWAGIGSSVNIEEYETRLKEGLEKFPHYKPLWIKAFDFYSGQSLQQGQRVISKAMGHFPNSREIVQIYAMTTHARANELKSQSNPQADTYFADAEQGYYHMVRIEGPEPKIFRELQRLYEDWGEGDLASTCEQALDETKTNDERWPYIAILVERKNQFSKDSFLVRIQERLTKVCPAGLTVAKA